MKAWPYKLTTILLIFSLFNLYPTKVVAQKKIVVLGSSTAEGWGIWGNGWVDKYRAYLQAINPLHTVINRGYGGFSTNNVMPTGYPSSPDPTRNITYAIAQSPDIIIVNLPTNDILNGISIDSTMARYRLLKQLANNAGATFYVSTSQPKQGYGFYTKPLRDSVLNGFGSYALNFFDTVATPDYNNIRTEYSYGDGTHLNEAGHEILFSRVQAKPILGFSALPILFKSFNLNAFSPGYKLTWELNGSNETFVQVIQRSIDGLSFIDIGSCIGSSMVKSYSFFDQNPLNSVNYYRIKVSTSNNTKYSKILLGLTNVKENTFSIIPNPVTGNTIRLKINQAKEGNGLLTIYNTIGKEILHKSLLLKSSSNFEEFELPYLLPKGIYLVKLIFNGIAFEQSLLVQ